MPYTCCYSIGYIAVQVKARRQWSRTGRSPVNKYQGLDFSKGWSKSR